MTWTRMKYSKSIPRQPATKHSNHVIPAFQLPRPPICQRPTINPQQPHPMRRSGGQIRSRWPTSQSEAHQLFIHGEIISTLVDSTTWTTMVSTNTTCITRQTFRIHDMDTAIYIRTIPLIVSEIATQMIITDSNSAPPFQALLDTSSLNIPLPLTCSS